MMAVALMASVMTAARVMVKAMAAVAVMATAMAAARQQRQWQQQQLVGEIQQSTKNGITKTAMATEMATVIDSNNNNVNANANGCALMTATRMTCSGCASQWWQWRQCQWWGGEHHGNGEQQIKCRT
jgi:hypothetical protein